mmetsp:Transcript_13758/g.13826  ORF Transcript_13758/g.13826 Transcript_13758/m.13826 type:complete len:168 (-) Transcript_13758:121-624(-)
MQSLSDPTIINIYIYTAIESLGYTASQVNEVTDSLLTHFDTEIQTGQYITNLQQSMFKLQPNSTLFQSTVASPKSYKNTAKITVNYLKTSSPTLFPTVGSTSTVTEVHVTQTTRNNITGLTIGVSAGLVAIICGVCIGLFGTFYAVRKRMRDKEEAIKRDRRSLYQA